MRTDADHTMFRIKDAKVSLKFYTEILGMELGSSFSGYRRRTRNRS